VPAGGSLRESLRAYVAHLRASAAGRAGGAGSGLTAERIALAKSRREKIDLEVAALRGTLVDRRECLEAYRAVLRTVSTSILALGARHAHEFLRLEDEREVLQRMERMHREELARIADPGSDGQPRDPYHPRRKAR
jgi:hypothetical protein